MKQDIMKHGVGSKKGFTLLELLVVIAIIGILSAVIVPVAQTVREKALYAKAQASFKSIETALTLYKDENSGEYPAEADRAMPAGLETHIAGGAWPAGPWPGSEFDWDNWDDPDTGEKIYQISLRFCPAGGPIEMCRFPALDWAEDFDINSALYYCIQGDCRSDITEVFEYPGKCENCTTGS